MELREALAQIAQIRAQIARTETFDGYRSASVGFSGLLALATAGMQPFLMPRPDSDLVRYLLLWIGVAAISAAIAGGEMILRCRRASSELSARRMRLAVQQFVPCLIAGALVTFVISGCATEVAWMLPGLWSILFGLGVFASACLLPRPVLFVAVYYLLAGAAVLATGSGPAAFSPWSMAATFGVGQLSAAAVLYFTLERDHGEAQ